MGKSTIAVNLAVVLAKQLPNKVALVDLYTQFGDVAAMLSLTPKRTVSELEGVPGEFDVELISD
ncbi:MAG: histidine kinase, partial [Armatimonadota bacterium]